MIEIFVHSLWFLPAHWATSANQIEKIFFN